ncbi:MAG: hypothetical protein Ct9H300mP1_28910 [Planctomycetaceae bacterium]|nr:MAG: hypothetical protein Ct9H300mP1_28910 [Planctomycetaceae bacterium]
MTNISRRALLWNSEADDSELPGRRFRRIDVTTELVTLAENPGPTRKTESITHPFVTEALNLFEVGRDVTAAARRRPMNGPTTFPQTFCRGMCPWRDGPWAPWGTGSPRPLRWGATPLGPSTKRSRLRDPHWHESPATGNNSPPSVFWRPNRSPTSRTDHRLRHPGRHRHRNRPGDRGGLGKPRREKATLGLIEPLVDEHTILAATARVSRSPNPLGPGHPERAVVTTGSIRPT